MLDTFEVVEEFEYSRSQIKPPIKTLVENGFLNIITDLFTKHFV